MYFISIERLIERLSFTFRNVVSLENNMDSQIKLILFNTVIYLCNTIWKHNLELNPKNQGGKRPTLSGRGYLLFVLWCCVFCVLFVLLLLCSWGSLMKEVSQKHQQISAPAWGWYSLVFLGIPWGMFSHKSLSFLLDLAFLHLILQQYFYHILQLLKQQIYQVLPERLEKRTVVHGNPGT